MSFEGEIARQTWRQVRKLTIIVFWSTIIIGMLVGMYFLDHYRWGGCK